MVSEIEKLILFPKALAYAFNQMPLNMEIGFICSIIGMLGLIYAGVISPIIFNYFIIPSIEKKIGRSLQYDPLYDYIFLSRWMGTQNEVALYIVRRYCALIFNKDHGLPEKRNRFALKKAGYTIDMASRFEIIMSFLCVLNFILIAISSVVMLIVTRNHPFHK